MDNSGIIARNTIVKNELGMHARPASTIAKLAADSRADIWLCVDANKVDATSVIDILTLCAVKGTQVLVEIEDEADVNILEQIVDFFEDGFGE